MHPSIERNAPELHYKLVPSFATSNLQASFHPPPHAPKQWIDVCRPQAIKNLHQLELKINTWFASSLHNLPPALRPDGMHAESSMECFLPLPSFVLTLPSILYLFTHFVAAPLDTLKVLAICEIFLLPFPVQRIMAILFFSLRCFPVGIDVQLIKKERYT